MRILEAFCANMKFLMIVYGGCQFCHGQTIIYSEDFANGIPSTWTQSAMSQGSSNSYFHFAYRGPNTNPNCNVGSTGAVATNGTIGLLSSNQSVIASLTPSNGFVIIDPDAFSGSFTWNFGGWHFYQGLAPAPHMNILKTHYFDFQCYDSIQLAFNQFYRRHSGSTYVDISIDNGATWHSNQINSNVSTNNQTPTNSVVTLDIGNLIAGQDSVQFRFRYVDNVNSGWGGYFWMIDDIRIINYSNPFAVTSSNHGVICDGDSIHVQGTYTRANYQWSTGDTSQTIYLNQAGLYSLISSDQCGIDTVVFDVTQSYRPVSQISCGNSTSLCQGDTLNVSASGAGSYIWSNGGLANVQNFTTNGRHYVIGFDSTGYCSDTVEFTINILPIPNLSIIGPTKVCPGDSALWTVSGANTFVWSNGDTTSTLWVKNAGYYSVVGADSVGCTSTITKQFTIDHPDTLLYPSGNLNFCPGTSVNLSGSSNQTYLWNTGDTTQSITVTQAGSFFAIVSTINGCMDTTGTYTFTLLADPDTTVTATQTLFCASDSATISAASGYDYLWNTGNTTQSITVNTAGGYYVTLTSTDGCMATTDTTMITVVPDIVLPQITSNGLGWVITGSTTGFSVPVDTNYSYQWGVIGGSITFGQGTDSIAVTWGIPDSNVAVWVVISNGVCSDSVGISINISGIGVDEGAMQNVRLFPNPNDGYFTVEVGEAYVGASYEVVDGMGRTIERGVITSTQQGFDLADKPKGVYRIALTKNEKRKTLMVVIQ